MDKEFFGLQAGRDEWQELYRAMLARFLIETAMREEQGLEPVPYPPILERLECLLGLSMETAHDLLHKTDAELWEFNWFSFTDEWAWFRARQDVLKELGSAADRTKRAALEHLIERRYEEKFQVYVEEVAMRETSESDKKREHKKK